MLCPKCGYITFDKLDTCPKCRGDWSGIAEKISGTSSSIDPFCFLRKVIGEENKSEGAASFAAVKIDETPSVTMGAGLPEEEGIEMSLDGLPQIDLSGFGSETPKEEAEAEFELSFDDENEAGVGVAKPPEPPKPQEAVTGQIGLDLNDIDLSDLVTQQEASDSVAGMNESLDLDLASLEIDPQQSGSSSIDLDFGDDEDGLNLSLELEPQATSSSEKKRQTAIPDLGLNLDLDE